MDDHRSIEQDPDEREWLKPQRLQAVPRAERAAWRPLGKARPTGGRLCPWKTRGTRAASLLMLLVLSVSTSCQGSSSQHVDSLVVSYSPFHTLALLWTADEQGFFGQNGLSVTLREYATGAASADGVLHGEADISIGVSEFALVGRALKKESFRILACVDQGEHLVVVARKDRGIEEPSDLKGKTVGTTIGTIAEFYLGRFLELNGMSTQDVTVIDLKTPAEWVNSVVNGDVDAVVTAQPYANSARDGLGDNAVVWSAQSNQPAYALVVTTDKWTTEHPELAKRFLQSLAQAEEYVLRHPAEAKATMQRRLDTDSASIDTAWPQHQYALTLGQSLIVAMEDEARWMIANDLTTNDMPDFLDYISEDALRAVKPEAVTIIR